MGTYKVEVFLASRFEEFKELRAQLCREIAQTTQMAPIDLNDGYARPDPPLAECLSRVRRAELMVLLLGQSYGSNAPGSTKSFTHLEYDEAVRDTTKTRVLVYRVKSAGELHADKAIPETWLRELQDKHTIRDLGADEPTARCSLILNHLRDALERLPRGGTQGEDGEVSLDDLPDVADDAFEEDEIERLEANEAEAYGERAHARENEGPAQLEGKPAATAALEQRLEAERAITLREYGIAIQHLKKSLELRPLDGRANFQLARLYVVLDRRDLFPEAANLAERAARIETDEQQSYRACRAYLLAARARAKLGDTRSAHEYVNLALEAKPRFARAHIERARILCDERRTKDAIDAVHLAFQSHNESLLAALRDPDLQAIRGAIREMLREKTQRYVQEVEGLLELEAKLGRLGQVETPTGIDAPSTADSLHTLRRRGQESVARQRNLVSSLLKTAEGTYRNSLTETRSSLAATLSAEQSLTEGKLKGARAAEHEAAVALEAASKLPRLINWGVLLPLVIAITFALTLASPWLSTVVTVIAAVVSARNLWHSNLNLSRAKVVLDKAHTTHTQRVSNREGLEASLLQLTEQQSALRIQGQAARTLAQEALELFERRSLAMPPRYQPYSNLRRAQRDKLVRVSARAIEQFESAYSRRVERDDDGFWLAEPSAPAPPSNSKPRDDSGDFRLYRVIASTPNAIRLSRKGAYQPAVEVVKSLETPSRPPVRHSGIFAGRGQAKTG